MGTPGRESCWHTSPSATRHKTLLKSGSGHSAQCVHTGSRPWLSCTALSRLLSLARGCWPHSQGSRAGGCRQGNSCSTGRSGQAPPRAAGTRERLSADESKGANWFSLLLPLLKASPAQEVCKSCVCSCSSLEKKKKQNNKRTKPKNKWFRRI